MNFLNRLIISLITINMMCLPALAVLDIDASVDYEIRRKYNPNKIENDLLPSLPNKLKNDKPLQSSEDFTKPYEKPVTKTTTVQQPTKQQVITQQQPPKYKSYGQTLALKRGTSFTIRNTSSISDRMTEGTKVYFKLPKPIKTKYFTLPENTRFVGVISDSHSPQLTGNGGLVVIRIEKVIINGRTQEVSGKVTKANYKRIYFNNIKGKRKYWSNLAKSIAPGKRFNDKMWKSTKKLASEGVTFIFSPFTLASGLIVFGANIVASPVIAIFSKGGSISIPADTAFRIKLTEDVTIYN